MPTPNLHECVARIIELDDEVEHLSGTIGDATSIIGAALSNPSLLLINSVKPEHLRKLWRLPSNPPDIEKALPEDLGDYINGYLEIEDDIPTEGGLSPWKAHFRSCDAYYALDEAIERGLLHHPDRNLDDPLPYGVLNGALLDLSYMYWINFLVLVTPDMPNLTVFSVQPQQGPPNQIMHTEFWTLVYFALHLSDRVKNPSDMPVRLISICDTKARIVSANFSREYLRFIGMPSIPREGKRVCCDVSVEDYQDLQDKQDFLYMMHRISEVAVKADPDPSK